VKLIDIGNKRLLNSISVFLKWLLIENIFLQLAADVVFDVQNNPKFADMAVCNVLGIVAVLT